MAEELTHRPLDARNATPDPSIAKIKKKEILVGTSTDQVPGELLVSSTLALSLAVDAVHYQLVLLFADSGARLLRLLRRL